MNFVVALDSFKGSLSAQQACRAVSRGLLRYFPEAGILLKPMADGGEGTASALAEAGGGTWVSAMVTGPLPGKKVGAGYAWFPETGVALVEMAAASGLTLLAPGDLNPMRTTTYGTGELIRLATERGARKILLAVGGSATVDAGVGAASALGWAFLDASGRPVEPGGRGLADIARIVAPGSWFLPPVEVLCDVDNPLVGPQGAAPVYGPQKGADPAMVKELEAGLEHLAQVLRNQSGVDIAAMPGAGAAGGLAGGAVAFMGGRLVPGIDAVMDAAKLDEALAGADWVITGEGRVDRQSLRGKVIHGVSRRAGRAGVPVAVIGGSVELDVSDLQRAGITVAEPAMTAGMTLSEAMRNAENLVEDAAFRLGKKLRDTPAPQG